MRLGVVVLIAIVVAVGWTNRDRLPFVGPTQQGSAAAAGSYLVQMSDQGLLGGRPGPHLAAGAVCTATSPGPGLVENPTLAQAGVSFSFYNCRLRLRDHTTQRWCVAGGGGGGQPGVQYTGVPGTCQRPIVPL
jgi:hypothetical protein